MNCIPPGSSVQGILKARILEWVVISSSRDLSDPGIEPTSPALAGRFFTTEPPGKLERDGGGGGRPKKKEKAEKKMKKQQKNIFVQRKVKKKKIPLWLRDFDSSAHSDCAQG